MFPKMKLTFPVTVTSDQGLCAELSTPGEGPHPGVLMPLSSVPVCQPQQKEGDSPGHSVLYRDEVMATLSWPWFREPRPVASPVLKRSRAGVVVV